ncbi:MAG TPA: hypothetical protein VHH93_02045 [Gammaproteobacteria bacterium]|jgi:hypothetical protein|nr:hypothetical protein [Gammaproteobacteria bacterium]
MNQNPFQQRDRPVALIFISLFVFIMAGFSMMSVISAIVRVTSTSTSTEGQQLYVSSLTFIDYGLVLLANLALLIGGAALFLLRKAAFYLFLSSVVLVLIKVLWESFAKTWFTGAAAVDFASEPWVFLGVFIGGLVGICWYTRKLMKEGLLY